MNICPRERKTNKKNTQKTPSFLGVDPSVSHRGGTKEADGLCVRWGTGSRVHKESKIIPICLAWMARRLKGGRQG